MTLFGPTLICIKPRNELEVTVRQEEIARKKSEAEAETAKRKAELQTEQIAQRLAVIQAQINADLTEAQKRKEAVLAKEDVANVETEADLQRRKWASDFETTVEKIRQTLKLESLKAETDAVVTRFGSAQPGFSEALTLLGNQEILAKVAEAASIQTFLGGKSLPDILQKIFQGSGLDGALTRITERAQGVLPENGGRGVTTPPQPARNR